MLRTLRLTNILNGACLLIIYPLALINSLTGFDITACFFAVYCV